MASTHMKLGSALTFIIPSLIVVLGGALWTWAFVGGPGLSTDQTSDVMNVGSGIVSGGIVALVVVWLEHRLSERQQDLIEKFQLSTQSDLTGIDLRDRDLTGIYLSGKDLTAARFTGSTLDSAVLVNTMLKASDLSGASMRSSSLIDANLDGAFLTGANLEGANAIDANFDNTTLIGAVFRNSRLTGASFIGADGSGADFSNANLTPMQLAQFATVPSVT